MSIVYANGDVVRHKASGTEAVVVSRDLGDRYNVAVDFGNVVEVCACEMELVRRGIDPDEPLPEFETVFSGRALRAISGAGITTWQELEQLSRRELEIMPYVGKRTIADINEALITYGFRPK